jgi:copper homeostasis protein
MKSDIHFCGENACDGVVIGMLNADGTIEKKRCKELIKIAEKHNMSITFHRAFDRTADIFQALEDVIELGCRRILTSGGFNSAIEGAEIISQLAEKSNGRIIIMPGAGITPENADVLLKIKNLHEFHGTFRSRATSKMQFINKKMNADDYNLMQCDAEKITAMLKKIKERP